MARYADTNSALGFRIIEYRKTYGLTQEDLAKRFGVSAPAIFKFEAGFVMPSLKLWQRIASGIGIPEREAVLLWAHERLPENMKDILGEAPSLDAKAQREELLGLGKQPSGQNTMRDALLANPDLSPTLKRFVAKDEMWTTLKPSAEELLFLVDLTQKAVIHNEMHLCDAMIVARAIEKPGE